MKNIHILPTDKPSRLFYNKKDSIFTIDNDFENVIEEDWFQDYNIYITNDENKKIGDYIYDPLSKTVHKVTSETIVTASHKSYYKIILTTDQDLIKDNVQAIDDEFLEWFVKNPSCEEVEVETVNNKWHNEDESVLSVNVYGLIIPKEEPKQETLEEAAGRCAIKENRSSLYELGMKYFIEGAKWQQEKMYSEEEVVKLLIKFNQEIQEVENVREWFEQFKKK